MGVDYTQHLFKSVLTQLNTETVHVYFVFNTVTIIISHCMIILRVRANIVLL